RNMAISGSTSLDHAERVRRDLETQDADTLGVVVLTTGGNDLIHNYGRSAPREGAMYGATLDQARPWIEAFQRRLEEMLDLIDERFPGGCQVFLADIYDPSDGVGDPPAAGLPPWKDCLAILGAYNEAIHRAAAVRPNVHLVPMHAEFLGHGVHCAQPWREHYRRKDPSYWYGVNLEDPNDRGYDAIRRLFLREMVKVLPNLSEPRP
ncbi:MAG: SGNH/GDSL hydrolase family protein, partial [Pirellulales bacterium]|nr:SGNH/GDSL hydrolase family protein [Pirellulales bacterium]